MSLEQTLNELAEYVRTELHIVRKRADEKTAPREHGNDFHEMQQAADKVDHLAHTLRRLHDEEFSGSWRRESAQD
ncbi:hypothetical protein [Leifsonia sp. 21MFCrub1.1]|uniref:hypothetical protein n=1 Tax=Leifsonia sp. 21MFCrub1.1 TaxID=1798223 RepID=UPI0008928AD8|nr:hypothetical protein [Leifsonia sp. 21MFCrub1.1]SEA98041.1 hypothetical protein SAMN04515680_2447 [Leifsonia sp. 21MFCrub1.1]